MRDAAYDLKRIASIECEKEDTGDEIMLQDRGLQDGRNSRLRLPTQSRPMALQISGFHLWCSHFTSPFYKVMNQHAGSRNPTGLYAFLATTHITRSYYLPLCTAFSARMIDSHKQRPCQPTLRDFLMFISKSTIPHSKLKTDEYENAQSRSPAIICEKSALTTLFYFPCASIATSCPPPSLSPVSVS